MCADMGVLPDFVPLLYVPIHVYSVWIDKGASIDID